MFAGHAVRRLLLAIYDDDRATVLMGDIVARYSHALTQRVAGPASQKQRIEMFGINGQRGFT